MAAVAVSAVLLVACGGGGSSPSTPPATSAPTIPPIQRISSDGFTVAPGQHASEVEPSALAVDNTIVAAFQVGRTIVAGATAIGYATSQDGGTTWMHGTLPGLTKATGGALDAASDAVVAYDAAHKTWLIASLPVIGTTAPTTDPAPYVSRSTDGVSWSAPVLVANGELAADKEWIVCDNGTHSPFFGHCYVQWDDASLNGLIRMSVSTDGGATWGPETMTAGNGDGLGGQPIVQPNGTVIVPMDDFNEARILAFVSHDGGSTWSEPALVANIVDHLQAGNLRSGPLVTAAADGSGTVYALWQDCRFRVGCAADDLVYSISSNGVAWSAPIRVPIDATSSTTDHFIPGISVDPTTSGAGAHIGVTYYFYPTGNCGSICNLYAGFIGSGDGGATWSAPVSLAGPMLTTWLPSTTEGVMVADYVATVFVAGRPLAIFANALTPAPMLFDQAIYASTPPTLTSTTGAGTRRRAASEHPIPGVKSDHGPRRPLPPLF